MRRGSKTGVRLAAAVASISLMAVATAHADNLLGNPGFESGVLYPWFQAPFGDPSGVDWAVSSVDAHSGNFSAVDIGNKELREDIGVPSGAMVTQVSFWMRHPNLSFAPAAVDFFYSDATSVQFTVFSSSTDWQFFDVTSHLDTSKTLVGFGVFGYSAGLGNEVTRLDDLAISASVPEPSIWGLLLAGLAMAGAALRDRRLARG